MTCPLCSTGITPLRRYYEAVRPSPAHRYFRPRGWSRLHLFPWHRSGQVLTFHTRAWLSFAPPPCRMPLGQSQCIPQADPRGMATPRFWHRLIRFRHVVSGLLALASLNHACRNLVPAFPQRSPPWLVWAFHCQAVSERRSLFLAFLIGFFVRSGIPFLRPDPQYCKAGARRSCQGWPSHQPFHALCLCQAIP